MERYNCVIVGTGPAGLGTAFRLGEHRPDMTILLIDKAKLSTGGLRNDCKMNFTFPVGFPTGIWSREQAQHYLDLTERDLQPRIREQVDISRYQKRAERLGVQLLDVRQCHLGSDGGPELIRQLMAKLESRGVQVSLRETARDVERDAQRLVTDRRTIGYDHLVLAPGRGGFRFLQTIMDKLEIPYVDNIVDVGLRIETHEEHYPIVHDYYDPKFHFPGGVRTFCTNSGAAHVVKELHRTPSDCYYSINGHAYRSSRKRNGLVNLALLKTVGLTRPLASGHQFAEMLGCQAMLLGGGRPLMQRVGDFRLGKRSQPETFCKDLFDFEPTLPDCTAGDVSLAAPAKIMRTIWTALKMLDTISPGILHPATIMYYPEIKLYANKPAFLDDAFRAADNVYLAGDGAGTSRGITAAWSSGIRVADGILERISKGKSALA